MKMSMPKFIRYYQAPMSPVASQLLAVQAQGTWYAEYDGIWTVREFLLRSDDYALVAPFELTMRPPGHPTDPPDLVGITVITFGVFESLWERFAQTRLHELAMTASAGRWHADADICYVRLPFPAELKRDEAASVIYCEYAQGLPRRSFEVEADRTLVAPYDVGTPVMSTEEILRAVHEGVGPDGELIDPRVRPEQISHAIFETHWERHALARLRALAEMLSGTTHSEDARL